MSFDLDHVIIAVPDLQTAMQDYESLGFNVRYGGEHASGTTHNALIVFADGTYLELMAPTGRPKDPENNSADYSPLVTGRTGFVGYALRTGDLHAAVNAMRQRGVELPEPVTGGRKRSDGLELEWRTIMIGGSISPFFIEDISPRNWRIPDTGEWTAHANGVSGIRSLTFIFEDAVTAIERYEAWLGIQPELSDNGVIFRLGNSQLWLNPEGEGQATPSQAPYRLILESTNPGSIGLVQMAAAHGARLLITARPN